MKCRFCKDKATKSIDITYHPPQALVESLGTVFNKMVMGDVDDKDGRIKVELKSNKPLVIDETVEFIDDPEVFYREEKPGDEKMAEIFVCEDHHRLWELLYGGEVEEWGRKLEELKPEEREELEEATQKVWDEIEQIKERIRKKKKKGKKARITGKARTSPSKDSGEIQELDLLKPGNVGLVRLLLVLSRTSPNDGLPTRRLLEILGSTNHAQAFIKRAEKMGYIRREERDPESGIGFSPVYNILTEKGRKLLVGSQL